LIWIADAGTRVIAFTAYFRKSAGLICAQTFQGAYRCFALDHTSGLAKGDDRGVYFVAESVIECHQSGDELLMMILRGFAGENI
jgi:hypothetical protein